LGLKISALGWGCNSVVKDSPSMHKAWAFIPSIATNKQTKGKTKNPDFPCPHSIRFLNHIKNG
jgi:hypothetical protein